MLDFLLTVPGLAAIVALLVAGAIQGSTGFGFSMLAAPVLAVLDPALVPGPMIAMAVVISASGSLREFKYVDRADLSFALVGRMVATVPAAFCLGMLSPSAFSAFFGFAVLLAVALSVAGPHIETTPRNLCLAGSLSGFMGTLTSIGAPPMALVYQNSGGARMRATLNAFFLLGGLLSIAALAAAGNFGRSDIVLAAGMLPFAFLGFLLSGFGRALVDRGRIKLVVLAVSTVSGVVLLARAFT